MTYTQPLLYLSATNSKKRGSIVVGIVDLFIEPLHSLPNENNKLIWRLRNCKLTQKNFKEQIKPHTRSATWLKLHSNDNWEKK